MDRLSALFQKYYDKTNTPEEREELMRLLPGTPAELLEELIQRAGVNLNEVEHILSSLQEDKILKNILPGYDIKNQVSIRRVHFLKTAWFRYAAVILLLVGTGTYFWLYQNRQQTVVSNNKPLPTEISPGKEGAILTLADGSQVVLDSIGNGVIATQNGSRAVLKNGQLAYAPTGTIGAGMMYNTITTPKGRQFSVVLPDRTKVWLNAASSLRYPTVFSGRERQVTITGEAYFEVAKNKEKPFLVKINNEATVEVLGTSFNVNAYDDETSIYTTLLEGSVKVAVAASADRQPSASQPQVILKPRQQAQIVPVNGRSENGLPAKAGIKLIENADIDKVMAWKNGAFNFNGASLAEVMRQLERWYDIEVVYEKGIPDIHFVGEMSRGVSLAGLITGLEASEVHFRIEDGRRLVVMP